MCPTTTTAEDNANNDRDGDDDERFSKSSKSPRARGSTCQSIPRTCGSNVGTPRPRARDAGTTRPCARVVVILRTPARDKRPVYDVPHTGGSSHDVVLDGGSHVDVQRGTSDDDDIPDLHLDHGCDTP